MSDRYIRDTDPVKVAESAVVTPSSLDFGKQFLNKESATQSFIITNTSYDNLVINELIISGPFVLGSRYPAVIPAGESASIAVKFKPETLDAQSGGVYIDTGDAGGQEFVTLSGVGIPALRVDPVSGGQVGTGRDGKSAYEVAVANGFVGNQTQWLESLIGDDGAAGLSAYQLAVSQGYQGNLASWLLFLKGETGLSAYQVAVKNGFTGTEQEWLDSLHGEGTGGGSGSSVPVWTTKVITPYQYGGVGDGVADDTQALNDCFAAVRAIIGASRGQPNGWKSQIPIRIDLTGGTWRITGKGINATNLECWNLEITGGMFYGECIGRPILDLVNSRGFTLRQVGFWGNPNAMPSSAYQLARATAAGFCDNCSFYEVSTTGWYRDAAIICYAHETALHDHCTYFNYNHDAHVAVFQGSDYVKLSTEFSTVMAGDTSFINNRVSICDFRYLPIGSNYAAIATIARDANPVVTTVAPHGFKNGDRACFVGGPHMAQVFTVANASTNSFIAQGIAAGDEDVGSRTGGGVARAATKSPVVLARASDFNFASSYIVSYGQPHLLIRFDSQYHDMMEKITLDLLFEGSGQAHNVAILTGNRRVSVQGFDLRTYNSHAGIALIGIDFPLVHFFDVKISSYRQLTDGKLIAPESYAALYGAELTASDHKHMDMYAYANFTGECLSIIDGTIRTKGKGGSDAVPVDVRQPFAYEKIDTAYLFPTKLFGRQDRPDDAFAYRLTSVRSPFNPNYEGGNYIASHVRHVAEGTNKNGPRGAALGQGISMFKEGFGTGQAKGGEIDGLYIVLRQDSPRTGAQGINDPSRGDGCGILIDAAVHENVGFVGGIEGATTVLSNTEVNQNGGGVPKRRLAYQIGCTDTTTPASVAYFGSAAQGQHSAGLVIYSAENDGGYFDNPIQVRTDTVGLFNIDRNGMISMGRRLNNGTMIDLCFHMTIQNDYSLGWINAARNVQLMNLDQNGNLNVYSAVNSKSINTSIARIVPANLAGEPSLWVAGTLFVDGSNQLRFCDANGVAPKIVGLNGVGGGSGGSGGMVQRFAKDSARVDTKLFAREDRGAEASAYSLVEGYIAFNSTTVANLVGHHVRVVAEGSSQPGHRTATLAMGVSAFKEGFGTPNAKSGELDGIYVVTRQDGPRNNGGNDGWGVVVDTAGHQNVGWLGGLAGSTSLLSNTTQNQNGGGETVQQLGYHIGSIKDAVGSAIGMDVYAGKGALTAGFQVVNQESTGGYFENYIEFLTNTTTVFQVDRFGAIGFGLRANDGTLITPKAHLSLAKDHSLIFSNEGKALANMTITKDGNIYSRGAMYGTIVQASNQLISLNTITANGNIFAGGYICAGSVRLIPGARDGVALSSYVRGEFFAGTGGRLRYCDADGAQPKFVTTTVS